ncbi:MAG: molybdopterin-synthase adenylyltransferase MoeB [Candidatus Saccharibacteria bacterium]|nr:molybdopterin-synthase adenylyltransferase MoeB [Pseudorhodobacter sp.]
MILIAIFCAGLWMLGRTLNAPGYQRWLVVIAVWMLAFVWFRVPQDMDSDSARVWVLVTFGAVLVLGYNSLLAWLKRRKPQPVPPVPPLFQPQELDRYARHILLREIGGPGQKAMKQARVLVIGAGGLGSPALMYLAAAGVGVIGVMDDDVVEASNLQRQIIHETQNIGRDKVASAKAAMLALNPYVQVTAIKARFNADTASILGDYDLILDGSDNFDTRYLVNRIAAQTRKPLISAAITQWEGQISLYDPAHGTACYECIFPNRPAPGMVPTCAEAGVAAPLPGVVGAMMAMEAVKHLTGAGQGLQGRLMIYDALYAEVRVIGIKPRADCAVCGIGSAPY